MTLENQKALLLFLENVCPDKFNTRDIAYINQAKNLLVREIAEIEHADWPKYENTQFGVTKY